MGLGGAHEILDPRSQRLWAFMLPDPHGLSSRLLELGIEWRPSLSIFWRQKFALLAGQGACSRQPRRK